MTATSWLPLTHLGWTEDGRPRAVVELKAQNPWFAGHFPVIAILPGVALIGLVEALVRWSGREYGYHMAIHALSRVRFKKPAGPGDVLELSLTAPPIKSGMRLGFEVSREGEVIAGGLAVVDEEGALKGQT
jgi:3-hydroxymyristoyl/3-hydroxydecanoyl-(acyl carrier protein) dehydratase